MKKKTSLIIFSLFMNLIKSTFVINFFFLIWVYNFQGDSDIHEEKGLFQ